MYILAQRKCQMCVCACACAHILLMCTQKHSGFSPAAKTKASVKPVFHRINNTTTQSKPKYSGRGNGKPQSLSPSGWEQSEPQKMLLLLSCSGGIYDCRDAPSPCPFSCIHTQGVNKPFQTVLEEAAWKRTVVIAPPPSPVNPSLTLPMIFFIGE